MAAAALVVVNFGSSRLLERNLLATAAALPGSLVVVVDNPTTSRERETVVELCRTHRWEAVLPGSNLGFGAGMNRGVGHALERGASHVALLNPDLEVAGPALGRLFGIVERDPRVLVAPRIERPDGTPWSVGTDLDLEDGRMRSIRSRGSAGSTRRELWLSGACLVLSSGLWSDVGGFADDYFLYWEDVDLSHRVRAAGGRLLVCDDVTAVHAEGGTQGGGLTAAGQAKSRAYYYYNTRNRMLFASRFLSTEDIRRWQRHAWPVAREVLLHGGKRQLAHPASNLAPVVSGTLAGLRLSRAELRRRAATTASGR